MSLWSALGHVVLQRVTVASVAGAARQAFRELPRTILSACSGTLAHKEQGQGRAVKVSQQCWRSCCRAAATVTNQVLICFMMLGRSSVQHLSWCPSSSLARP